MREGGVALVVQPRRDGDIALLPRLDQEGGVGARLQDFQIVRRPRELIKAGDIGYALAGRRRDPQFLAELVVPLIDVGIGKPAQRQRIDTRWEEKRVANEVIYTLRIS